MFNQGSKIFGIYIYIYIWTTMLLKDGAHWFLLAHKDTNNMA